MSSRAQEKAAARETRLEAERSDAVHASRVRRIRVLIGLGLLALLVVVVAIAAGSGGGSGEQPAKKPSETASLFAGIPQNGLTLGKASARATLEEFVDPQ